jgi:hypothetical protein
LSPTTERAYSEPVARFDSGSAEGVAADSSEGRCGGSGGGNGISIVRAHEPAPSQMTVAAAARHEVSYSALAICDFMPCLIAQRGAMRPGRARGRRA